VTQFQYRSANYSPSALEIVVFFFAIWGAYLVRTMFQSTIGVLNFWTTRGAAMFDLYMTTELLLSGGSFR
jgi:ABC-2 type transport system permease protein